MKFNQPPGAGDGKRSQSLFPGLARWAGDGISSGQTATGHELASRRTRGHFSHSNFHSPVACVRLAFRLSAHVRSQ